MYSIQPLEQNPQFPIIALLQGVSLAEVQQCCYKHNLENLSHFRRIELLNDETMKATEEEQNKKLNDTAKWILQVALSQHLRRVNADHNYEFSLSLKTFASQPSVPHLDLDLDWLKLINEKQRLATIQEWEQILLPALLDVKQSMSEIVFSRRIHLSVKSILPVALALGFIFRESSRVTLLLEGQSETWSTDTRPSEKDPLHRKWISYDQGDQKIAVVEVTTKRSISQAVSAFSHMVDHVTKKAPVAEYQLTTFHPPGEFHTMICASSSPEVFPPKIDLYWTYSILFRIDYSATLQHKLWWHGCKVRLCILFRIDYSATLQPRVLRWLFLTIMSFCLSKAPFLAPQPYMFFSVIRDFGAPVKLFRKSFFVGEQGGIFGYVFIDSTR